MNFKPISFIKRLKSLEEEQQAHLHDQSASPEMQARIDKETTP
jgi:hypothetical protein